MFYWCRYPVPVSLGSIPLDGSIQLCVVSMLSKSAACSTGAGIQFL